jgi:hypothetical protein
MLNLTPHAISILNHVTGQVVTFPASGNLARVATETVLVAQNEGFHVYRTIYGDVEGVPTAGTEKFLVSAMVLAQLGGEYTGWAFAPKTDGTAVRNDKGHIVHVVGLVTV